MFLREEIIKKIVDLSTEIHRNKSLLNFIEVFLKCYGFK